MVQMTSKMLEMERGYYEATIGRLKAKLAGRGLAYDSRGGLARDDDLDDLRAEQLERDKTALFGRILDKLKGLGLDDQTRSEVIELVQELADKGGGASDERNDFEDSAHYRIGLDLFKRGVRGDAFLSALKRELTKLGASDEPPPFSGRPRPGGGMDPIKGPAMDAVARKSFAERNPAAARVAVDNLGVRPAGDYLPIKVH